MWAEILLPLLRMQTTSGNSCVRQEYYTDTEAMHINLKGKKSLKDGENI